MAVDFQVVFPQEAIDLSSIRTLPGVTPRALEITGNDFRAIDEVLINQIESPDVIILNQNKLIAQVPDSVALDAISSVSVLSRRLTITPRSVIRFRINDTPGKVRGLLRLIQLFLKLLFTTPGTDIFNRSIGGGGLRSLGATFSSDSGGEIVAGFVVAVDTTARQIIGIQGRDPSIPLDERLLNARVTKAAYRKNEGALVVSVELINQSGRTGVANVEL